jgi:hypothetical protein
VRLRLGECVLDTGVRELSRGGRAVHVSPKAFALLEVLAESRPRAVSKAELRERLWPDAMLGGASLARVANEVRVALGDDARAPRFLRTVPRYGYALVGGEESGPHGFRGRRAPFALQWGARLFPLGAGESVIGRAWEAEVSLPSAKVSRRHARIAVVGTRATLEDLGSRNGTFVGSERVAAVRELRDGDAIRCGDVGLIFRAWDSSSEDTQSID